MYKYSDVISDIEANKHDFKAVAFIIETYKKGNHTINTKSKNLSKIRKHFLKDFQNNLDEFKKLTSLKDSDYAKINTTYKNSVIKKLNKLVRIPESDINQIFDFIKTFDNIIPFFLICFITGRRPSEIFQADFIYIDDETLGIKNICKKRDAGSDEYYQIPCLYNAKQVLKSIEYYQTTNKSKKVESLVKQYSMKFQKFQKLTFKGKAKLFDVKNEMSLYSMRKLYASYCYFKNVEQKDVNSRYTTSQATYFSQILLHNESDISTQASYQNYIICK